MADIKVKCDKCGTVNMIRSSDVVFEQVGGQEREMGSEVMFEATFEITCTKCGAEIVYTQQRWEYPVGMENYSDEAVIGGVVV